MADLGTKALEKGTTGRHMKKLGCVRFDQWSPWAHSREGVNVHHNMTGRHAQHGTHSQALQEQIVCVSSSRSKCVDGDVGSTRLCWRLSDEHCGKGVERSHLESGQ